MLSLPALAVGFVLDDLFQRAQILDVAGPAAAARTRYGLFAFVDADPGRTRAMVRLPTATGSP